MIAVGCASGIYLAARGEKGEPDRWAVLPQRPHACPRPEFKRVLKKPNVMSIHALYDFNKMLESIIQTPTGPVRVVRIMNPCWSELIELQLSWPRLWPSKTSITTTADRGKCYNRNSEGS